GGLRDGAGPGRSRTLTRSTADSSALSTHSAAPPEASARARKQPASRSSSPRPTPPPSKRSARGSEERSALTGRLRGGPVCDRELGLQPVLSVAARAVAVGTVAASAENRPSRW